MLVKGKRTVVDYINVEIDPRDVIASIYDQERPAGLSHLSEDGYWYKVCGHDYHKNDELYEKDRPATPQELELQKAYRVFAKLLYKVPL